MRIIDFVEKFKNNFSDIFVQIKFNSVIGKVKFLDEDQLEFASSTLYIGDKTTLDKIISIPDNTSLIFISDCDFEMNNCKLVNCNVIMLRWEHAYYKVFNKAQDIILDSQRYSVGSVSLLECIIRGKELRDIIETGYDILNNPIMLMDTSYKVLAYKTDTDIDDGVWSDLVEHGYSSYKYVSHFKNEKIIEKILKSDLPIVLDTGVAEKIRRILGKIMIHDRCVGYIAVLEYKHEFLEQDIEITHLICEVISSMMNADKRLNNSSGIMSENIILDLLQARIPNRKELKGRLCSCEWEPGEQMMVQFIDISRYNDPSFIDYFRNQLNHIFPGSKSVFYNEGIILVLNISNTEIEESEHLKKVHIYLENNSFYAGESQMFSDLLLLDKHYIQALKALEIGKKKDKNRRIFRYKDYETYNFLVECSKYVNIVNYCHRSIVLLKEYDENNGTDYYKTLYQYLKNDKQVIATAGSLFIHRNTVNYRLEKIQEITGLVLKDLKDSFHIYLSFKILEAERLTKE